jgi:dipeptidyl aminopeptidase/acylaminoacyl peptidase
VSTYGHPERDRALLENIAPLASVHRIDVPLLVVHGDHDPNVPVAESRQVVAALRALGRSVKYLSWRARATSSGGPNAASGSRGPCCAS